MVVRIGQIRIYLKVESARFPSGLAIKMQELMQLEECF